MTKLTDEKYWRGDTMAILDTSGWDWGSGGGGGIIPPGTRCKARIVRIAINLNKNRQQYLMLVFESLDHPESDEFIDMLNFLSGTTMSPRERRRESQKWRSVADCFDLYLPESGQIDLHDWEGKEGTVEVDVNEYRGKPNNTVKEYVLPEN